jgi:hypothetical protein
MRNLLTMREWELIRSDFSEAEKAELNAANCGEALCPRGIFLDYDKVSPELQAKLLGAVNKATAQVKAKRSLR